MFEVVHNINKPALVPPLPLAHIYEAELDQGAELAAFQIYCQILSQFKPEEICRIWNFIPNIHINDHGDERYRQFCFGRHNAFKKFEIENINFPAATGIGSFDNNLLVGILTTKEPLFQLSNDMQINAYEYPRQHGRVGPSFSRATLADSVLYISGTASIRGHQTLHVGDVALQTNVTLENIEHLIEKANLLSGKQFGFTNANWRVYLRDKAHQDLVNNMLVSQKILKNIEYCHAEICRADLLIEIEGLCFGKI